MFAWGGGYLYHKINKIKLKYILSLVITVIGLFSLLGGTSYAILKGSTSSSKQQIIKTGSIKVKLTENFENIDKKITTMTDSDGLLQTETYEFNLKNIGDAPAKYDLKLVNEVPSDYTGNVLDTKYIKIGLEINGEEYGPFSLEEVNNIIDSDIIYEKEMVSYVLRIWLDEEKEEELLKLEDYKAFLKLKVEAEQRIESMDNGVETTLFSYTGDVQEYIVPRDGYYYIEMAGASSNNEHNTYVSTFPTFGAKTSGYIYLEAGEKLYFYVGGMAKTFNCCEKQGSGAGGGGATDVRLVKGNWNDIASLISRIMVSGGAGGTYGDSSGAYGTSGGTLFTDNVTHANHPVKVVSQTSGGSAGLNGTAGGFGYGGINSTEVYNSGGGGYYGGGSGPSSGGGSSYVSGYAGVNSVEESTTITHTNQTLHYSGKYFIGGQMFEGQNSGDGYAKITYVDTKPKRKNTNLNNVRYIKNCIKGNTANGWNAWTEIQAIKDGINIAKGKTASGVTTHSTEGGPITNVTDGIIDPSNYINTSTENASATECITVDLEQEYDLDEIAVWNHFGNQRRYYNNVTYVSNNNDTWEIAINEVMYEFSNGKRLNAYTETLNGYTGRENMILWYDGYANNGGTRNNTTTTWKNLASSSYSGTLTGGTWYRDYLYFDGTDDYVKIPSQSFTFPATYSFIYKTNSTASQIIFGQYNNKASIGIYNTSQFITSLSTSSSVFDTGGITLDKFYKVDVVYRSLTDKTIYINNKKINATSSNNYWSWTDTNSYIGRRASGTYFKGGIKTFLEYNKALTEEEILHNYLYDKQRFSIE